jgi:uncharacterized RDD family membrane protein YckC
MALRNTRPNLRGYYAGLVSRFAALVLDALFLSLAITVVAFVVSYIPQVFQVAAIIPWDYVESAVPQLTHVVQPLQNILQPSPEQAALLTIGLYFIYHVFFLTSVGRTPGKAVMGLRVVTTEGKPLSFWRSLLRVVFYPITVPVAFAILPLIWMLIDQRHQYLHDKLAGTYVIYIWHARPDERFVVDHIRQVESALPKRQPAE